MYRRMFGARRGPGDTSELPQSVKNRGKHDKRRRHSAPTVRRCHVYGPPRSKARFDLDMKILRKRFPQFAVDMDKKEKEKQEEEEESRIPEKEAEKLPALTVKSISFPMLGNSGSGARQQTQGNAKRHHTDRYTCNQTKDGQPVLRRGQEFKVRIVFDRPYNKEQDDLTFVMEADENPGKGLLVDFKMDEERKTPFDPLPHWAARLTKQNPAKCAIRVSIYIPANSVVGEWDLKVKTILRGEDQSYVYLHPTPFIVLFNPWCKEDQVYYSDDQNDLNEYILNDKSTAYFGTTNCVRCKAWTYGQFEKDIVQISLSLLRLAFSFKITSAMADPVTVSRALSRIVNSAGDNGVLVGNWSGDYEGGASPTSWSTSTAILRQYADTQKPVMFGQCWVFSHVLTAVCRALGLPCRSVTNFDSAHDTDNSCTIDCYYDDKGNEIGSMKSDSIWNFHVWNEVWLNHPEITEHDCNGWHVIDATPQEQSDGIYQCGPSPLKAIKNGLIHVPYDTAFIFSEVNADVVHWVRGKDGEFTPSAYKKKSVGSKISTKPCDGKPFGGNLGFRSQYDPELRLDLTDMYKHPEGTEEERLAVRRAVRQTAIGANLYTDCAEIEVDFDNSTTVMVGEDLKVTALVKNMSKEEKEVDLLISARTSNYWNDPDKNKALCRETPGIKKLKAGAEEKLQLTVHEDVYTRECDEDLTVYIYVRATDVKKNMPHSAQQPFKLATPNLEVKGPERSKPKEEVTLTVTLTNPLNKSLTDCKLSTYGDLYLSDDDPNIYESFFWTTYRKVGDFKPKETKTFEFLMYWEGEKKEEDEDSDEDDDVEGEAGEGTAPPEPVKEFKTQFFTIDVHELKAQLEGSHNIECYYP